MKKSIMPAAKEKRRANLDKPYVVSLNGSIGSYWADTSGISFKATIVVMASGYEEAQEQAYLALREIHPKVNFQYLEAMGVKCELLRDYHAFEVSFFPKEVAS